MPKDLRIKPRRSFGGRGLLLVVAMLAAFALTSRPAAAGRWVLLFEDHFKTSSLDTSAWWTRFIYANGTQDTLPGEAQLYRDGGHQVVSNGTLKLVAVYAPAVGREQKFVSGMIRSKQTFRYGYFEARIKIPSGIGLHPTFWLNSDYDGNGRLLWPPEIDIMESGVNGTTETPNMMHAGLITMQRTEENKSIPLPQDGSWIYSDPRVDRRWSYYRAGFDFSAAWHVYGMLWENDDTVTMFLDGKTLWKRRYKWVYNDGTRAGPAHILITLAVGGAWAGSGWYRSDFPASLEVDYVRVCKRSTGIGAGTCSGSPYTPK